MKNAKKLLSLILALIMTLAICVPAFAAGDPVVYEVKANNGAPNPTGLKTVTLTAKATEGTAYTLPKIDDAQFVTFNVPPYAGASFYGWSVKLGGGTAVEYVWDGTDFYVGGTEQNAIPADDITDSLGTTDPIVLEAMWAYTVEYVPNATGVTNMPDPTTVLFKITDTTPKINVPATAPTLTGNTFQYWLLGATAYAAGNTTDIEVNSNLTFLAKWQDTVTLTFDENGGTGTMADQAVAKNCYLPKCTFTAPTGKIFAGWKVEYVNSASETITSDLKSPGDEYQFTGSATDTYKLIAQWKDSPNTITIEGAANGHDFTAYQLFTGTVVGNKLANVQWGEDFVTTNLDDLVTALKGGSWYSSFTTEEKAKADALTEDSTAAAFAEVLSFIKADNDKDENEELANILADYIDTAGGTPSTGSASPYTITGLDDGYYIVIDETASPLGDGDFISDYILEVVNDVTVTVKGSVPEVDKKVSEDTTNFVDTAENDPLAAQIGKTLNYKITGTLPTNFEDFVVYKYVFKDTMSKGLTLVYEKDSSNKYLSGLTLEVDGNEIDAKDYTVVVTENTDGTTEFTVTIADMKAAAPSSTATPAEIFEDMYTVTHESVFTLSYNCILNADAVVEDGAENEVYLEYTRDPNTEDLTDTTTTPPDETFVEPIAFKFVKTDGTTDVLLTGAEFKLFAKEACATTDEIKLVACYLNSGAEVVVDPTDATEVDKIEYYRVATPDEITAASNLTDILVLKIGTVVIEGLDADEIYYLKETKAPAGYNLLQYPVEIQPSSSTDAANAIISSGKYNGATDGSIYNIKNNSGMELPATGGMGTVIFVAVGAAVFMATMLVLVTKKRMYNEG